MRNGKRFMGGPFDFNGDGKTTLDERNKAYKTKKHYTLGFIAGAVVIVCLIFAGVSMHKNVQLESTYEQAVDLVEDGSYDEAKALFDGIEEKSYKDTSAYIQLCDGLINYEKGDIMDAYFSLKDVKFRYIPQDEQEAIENFRAKLNEEYEVYSAKLFEIEMNLEKNKIKKGVPFVGMSESQIANTSLGAPSDEIRHNTEIMNGECYRANLYDFKNGNATIFTARCINGKVTQVWDHRTNPVVPYMPSKNQKPVTDSDPYHAKDYSDAEDFYDDYYDDFYDFEDAEDYYNEHN